MTSSVEVSETAVALEFEDFRTFINAFSANVSQSGMFLRVAGTRSPGSEIEFDLTLEGGDSLIRGRGKVAWVLGNKDSKAAGMGIRFLDLAPESQRLIERIVDVRTKAGRRLFDIELEAPPEARSGPDGAKRDASKAAETAPEDAITDLLRAQIESLKQERAEEQERFKAELETAQAAVLLLEQRLEEQATEIRRWSEQGKHALTERERLETDQEALTKGLEAAQTEIVRLVTGNQALRDSADQLEEVKRSLAEKQAAEEAQRGQLEAAQAEVARLETESEALRDSAAQLDEVKGSLAAAQAAEEALQEELSAARSAVERTEQKARETESQLRSELKEMEKSRADLREQLKQGQTELDDARRRFEESAERTLELEHNTTSLGLKLAEAREQIDSLESKTETIRAETEELRSQRNALELKLAAQTKIAKKARKLSQRARADRGRLQEFFSEAQVTLEKMQEEERRLEHELEEESAEIQRAADPAPQDLTNEKPAETIESEIPIEEEPEELRQSGLWAMITRTLGPPPAGEEHEIAVGFQVDAEEDGRKAVSEK